MHVGIYHNVAVELGRMLKMWIGTENGRTYWQSELEGWLKQSNRREERVY
jgi:hypothetical protein